MKQGLKKTVVRLLFLLACLPGVSGCGKSSPSGSGGEGAVTLVVITPHNENIKYEFRRAFSDYALEKYGREVTFQWRDVGGGSSSILQYLRNVYSGAETSGIDILFGGGEYTFQYLDTEGLLEPLELSEDVLESIPASFGGMDMISADRTWCGNCLLYTSPSPRDRTRSRMPSSA